MKRDLLCLSDLGEGGVEAMLDRSAFFARTRGKPSEHPRPLAGHAVALLFDKPSTRTRLSLEVATFELGGHPIVVTPESSQMGRGEPTEDTARVLGRMVSAVTYRTSTTARFQAMAKSCRTPVLNALTDVELPDRVPGRAACRTLTVSGMPIPVHRCEALVVGSGAAGLRAAVELKRRGVDVVVATHILFWGTSVCSGSDKQTLHTASTGRRGDDFTALAGAIAAGGAMDADTAYVEAVGSVDALAGLKYLGLPVPEDRFGAVLRYRTDHDEAGRATSCGPRTSSR